MKVDSIAILDCGGQYTKVIDRKVRQLSVRSDIHPLSVSPAALAGYQGIILSGGPNSVWAPDRLPYDPGIFDLGIPVLGICYGMQLINQHFGGVVAPGRVGEYGEATVRLDPACPLFTGLEPEQRVLMSHGDSAQTTPQGFAVSATSPDAVGAIYHEERKIYGVQFHPEVDLTPNGLVILRNFLTGICGLTGNYTMDDNHIPDSARVNVAFDSRGTVWIKDVELVYVPDGSPKDLESLQGTWVITSFETGGRSFLAWSWPWNATGLRFSRSRVSPPALTSTPSRKASRIGARPNAAIARPPC